MKKDWNNLWKDGAPTNAMSFSKKRIISILNKYISKDYVVLDAGCGSGFFSDYFNKQGCITDTLDYSIDALSLAKKTTNNVSRRYLEVDLLSNNNKELKNNEYDIIFTDGLFEHFEKNDQKKILNLFAKIKKNNGKIITFVPNKYSPWQLIRPFYMPGITETPFTMNELMEFGVDFDIIENGGINVIPFGVSPDKLLGSNFGMLLYTVCE